jgi:hypothetical protein
VTPAVEELLMRHLDGELDLAGEQEALALLERSAEARAFLRDLRVVGDMVRDVADARGEGVGEVADAVMARVAAELPKGLSVVGGTAGGGGAPRRLFRGGVSPVAAWGMAGATSLAIAAAVALYLSTQPAPAPSIARSPAPTITAERQTVVAAETVPEARDPEGGASIESVDFGTHSGAIFVVATGTPVLWMNDGEPDHDRMMPL